MEYKYDEEKKVYSRLVYVSGKYIKRIYHTSIIEEIAYIRQGDRYFNPLNNKYYRKRRGKLIEIPRKWLTKATTRATINRRLSKLPRAVKRNWLGKGRKKKYVNKNLDINIED